LVASVASVQYQLVALKRNEAAEFIGVVSLVSVVIPWQRWQLCQRSLGKPLFEYRS